MKQKHPSTDTLIDYIHRELSPEDDAAILLHVESCDECRVRYETEARVSEALRLHARNSERELPQGVVNSIWAEIDSAPHSTFGERLRAAFRPVYALPVAAAAAVAIYFGVAAQHQAPVTTIDAAYYLDDHAALTSTTPFGEGNAVPAQLENDQLNENDVAAVLSTVITTADAAH